MGVSKRQFLLLVLGTALAGTASAHGPSRLKVELDELEAIARQERADGAMLSGELIRQRPEGLPDHTVFMQVEGTGGQRAETPRLAGASTGPMAPFPLFSGGTHYRRTGCCCPDHWHGVAGTHGEPPAERDLQR